MLSFREVNRKNLWEVLRLSVAEGQKHFVAPNSVSLAQAKVQPECVPLAVYDGERPIGFAMYGLDYEEREYWIYRLMIDEKYQSRGYGRRGMEMLIEKIKQEAAPDHHVLFLSFEPDNEWGRKLYTSLGFVDDNRMDHGEVVFRLGF